MPTSLNESLDAEEDVALVLDREGRVCHVNAAWDRHARASGAPELTDASVLGTRYVDAVGGPQREVIARCVAAALEGVEAPGILVHSECNTPTAVRELTTHFASLRDERGEVVGVVVRQSLRYVGEVAALRETSAAPPEAFRDARGVIVQCGCCRRVRVPAGDKWTTCLALLAGFVAGVSHSLCATCSELYYAEFLR